MQGTRLVAVGKSELEFEKFSVEKPNSGEILVETRYTLISPGTEIAFITGAVNTSKEYPLYPGYCNVGMVKEVGEGVTGFKKGGLVASKKSHSSLLVDKSSEFYQIPEGVKEGEAVFLHVLHIAAQGVRKARIELGEPLAIIGMGLIGQLSLLLARLNGAHPILALDLFESRLKLAKKLGAKYTLNPKDDNFSEKIKELKKELDFNICIEASGSPAGVDEALKLVAYRGRLILLGSTRGINKEVNFYRDVHSKGINLIGAHEMCVPAVESHQGNWIFADNMNVFWRLFQDNLLDVKPLITDKINRNDAIETYQELIKMNPDIIGVIIKW